MPATAPPPLEELAKYPTMTRWFRPGLLAKLLWRVVVSELFGQYADRRLIVAALDTVSDDELIERAQQFAPGSGNDDINDFRQSDHDRTRKGRSGSTTSPISATGLTRPMR